MSGQYQEVVLTRRLHKIKGEAAVSVGHSHRKEEKTVVWRKVVVSVD